MVSATNQPLISVIMPAYNAQTYIGASITGVLTQTYPNYELVIVDDGSTDRTAQIVEAYGDCGGKLRYIRQENSGSSAARNRGMREARGELIALCDSDDVYSPRYLEAMLETYRKAGGGRRLVMSNGMLYTDTGVSHGRELVGRGFPPYSLQRIAILQQNFVPYLTLFPREMADEIGGFAEDLGYVEDWDFFLRAIIAGWQVEYQRVPLVEYRWTAGSKTTDTKATDAADVVVMRRAAKLPGLSPEELEYLAKVSDGAPPRQLDLRANQALREGRYKEARSLYREVSALKPVNRKQKIRTRVLGSVPGAVYLWRYRLRHVDTALGRAEGDSR